LGNLQPGTGLLLDMGRPVTVTAARIILGSARGASLQIRIGAEPVLADMRPAAHAVGAGGVVRLRLTTPAHGRYVLVWFTRLPPDPAGTFQASIYGVRLEGPA
ncbi:MAG TPA: serine/threonine protein kinase, partial [Streptosporangiaceae bacterium]|nr:serine/threonine protein kinase [Streptosporangiaceae bacterium]